MSNVFAVSKLASFSLPPSKHRWVSSVLVLQDTNTDADTSMDDTSIKHNISGGESGSQSYTVVCGDRKGSLHVYRSRLRPIGQDESRSGKVTNTQSCQLATYHFHSLPLHSQCLQPLQSLFGIHGPNGATCVTYHDGCVFTAGRDGYCRQFSLNHSRGLTELTKFKVGKWLCPLLLIDHMTTGNYRVIVIKFALLLQPVKDMGWIEQLMFTEEDLLVLGFHTVSNQS